MQQGNLDNKERDLLAPVWAISAPQKVKKKKILSSKVLMVASNVVNKKMNIIRK